MKKKPKIYLREKVYIPKKLIRSLDEVKRLYQRRVYDEKTCSRCSNKSERFNDICATCPAHIGLFKLWAEKTVKNVDYITLPTGDLPSIEKKLDINLSQAVDKRNNVPFKYKLKFTGKLHTGEIIDGTETANQVEIIDTWMKKKYGFIQAAPRTGKTVMSTYISCKLGVKTLIVANQDDLLRNFLKTYKALTNLKELRREYGKPIVQLIDDVSDITKDTQVAIITYQKFIRKDTSVKRVRKYLNKMGFSLLIVDEAHTSSALAYNKFLNQLKPKYKLALTATPKRKDGMHWIGHSILGPITATSDTKALIPNLNIFFTKIKPKTNYNNWTYAIGFLAKNEERNKLIVREFFKDLRAGHRVLIISDRRIQIDTLTKMINKQAGINNIKRGENWPLQLVTQFYRGVDKVKALKNIDNDIHYGLVCQTGMMKQGIDMKKPTMLYQTVPTSNPGMFYQLTNRVCTPDKGKIQPQVKMFVDEMGLSKGCFRSIFRNEIMPNLIKGVRVKGKYKMSEEDYKTAMELLKASSGYKPQFYGKKPY